MRLVTLLLGFVVVLLAGMMGFHILEGKDYFDAFYMTAVTVTTVGFTDHRPVTTAGRAFTLVILFAGFGIAFATLSQFAAIILRGELRQLMGRRKMEQEIKQMKHHYIICGMGRVGQVVAQEFLKKKISFVIIDQNVETMEALPSFRQVPFVRGNATEDEILTAAGISGAKGVVAAVSSDADNAFICMTARGLNSNLRIVTRAVDAKSATKLKLAGADKVVSPYATAGTRMAQTILNPSVVDFMEIASDQGSPDVDMADVEIAPGCIYDGLALSHPEVKALDVIIVGIHRLKEAMLFHPDAKTVLHGGDRLIAVGRPRQIQEMIRRVHDTKSA